eukprot:1147774-Pelagomonas_calceolata.AAC.2
MRGQAAAPAVPESGNRTCKGDSPCLRSVRAHKQQEHDRRVAIEHARETAPACTEAARATLSRCNLAIKGLGVELGGKGWRRQGRHGAANTLAIKVCCVNTLPVDRHSTAEPHVAQPIKELKLAQAALLSSFHDVKPASIIYPQHVTYSMSPKGVTSHKRLPTLLKKALPDHDGNLPKSEPESAEPMLSCIASAATSLLSILWRELTENRLCLDMPICFALTAAEFWRSAKTW